MKSTIAIATVLVAGVIGYAMWPTTVQTTDTSTTTSLVGDALVTGAMLEFG